MEGHALSWPEMPSKRVNNDGRDGARPSKRGNLDFYDSVNLRK